MQFRGMVNDQEFSFDESPTMFGTSPGWFVFWCVLSLLLVGIIGLVIWHLQLSKTRLQIRGNRVRYITGFISKRESEVRAEDVRDIEITKTFWQRMAGTGTLALSTSGESGMEIVIAGLRDPERVREIINASRG